MRRINSYRCYLAGLVVLSASLLLFSFVRAQAPPVETWTANADLNIIQKLTMRKPPCRRHPRVYA